VTSTKRMVDAFMGTIASEVTIVLRPEASVETRTAC